MTQKKRDFWLKIRWIVKILHFLQRRAYFIYYYIKASNEKFYQSRFLSSQAKP